MIRVGIVDRYAISELDGAVPNSLWDAGSSTLLVMLPGLGYTNQMPVMFYLQQLAMARGWDVLQVNYDYRGMSRDVPADERDARFVSDARPLVEAALDARERDDVILAGKSIGTRVMAALLNDGFDAATAYIWLTPLFADPDVLKSAGRATPSVAVFGDEDSAMGEVTRADLAAADISSIVMPGGDHSLGLKSRPVDSIAALADVYRQLDDWLTTTISN